MRLELYTIAGKLIGEIELPELPVVGDQVRIQQTDTSAPKTWVVSRRGWNISPIGPGQAAKKTIGMLFVELVN
jgi:hypothetical protein